MLTELEKLLSIFEWLTNEFQGNEVSSSRVYPCISSVKIKLTENINDCVYTQLRKDLYASLIQLFDDFIENDCFKIIWILFLVLNLLQG